MNVDEIIRRFESNAIPLANYGMMRDGRGLYCLFQDNRCLYVGRSKSVQDRIDSHVSGNGGNASLHRYIARHGHEIYLSYVYLNYRDSVLHNIESMLIRRLQPRFNQFSY